MASREYEALEDALVSAGVPTDWSRDANGAVVGGQGPVAVLVNTRLSARPYVQLLLDALPKLSGMELEMVVRALSERGMPGVAPVLASMMADAGASTSVGWALGNALATIRDPATFETIVRLAADRRLGADRQMLFSLLPRIGTPAAFDVAMRALDDDSVRGHALEALGRFGRLDAVEPIRQLVTRPGLYEHKAKATALRRLERLRLAAPDAT